MNTEDLYAELLLERFGPIPLRERPGRIVYRKPSKGAPKREPQFLDAVVRQLARSGLPDWTIADRAGCSEAMVAKIRNRRQRGG